MENWEQRFDRIRTPDSSVPSHREELRKKLQSNQIPGGSGRRAAVTLALAALVMLGGLTAAYPSWAKDLWKTIFVQTIVLHTQDGHTVVVKKFPLEGCSSFCDTSGQMKMIERCERRAIYLGAEAENFNLTGEAGETITISTPDCDKIWIVNGDTITAENMVHSVEQVSEDAGAFSWDPRESEKSNAGSEMSADRKLEIASDFELHQNYPNPFNPSTQIAFDLKQSGPVTLKVYNLMGQEIATLLNEYTTAGHHTVTFDGSGLPSGNYLYTLKTAGYQLSKMMVLTK